MHGANGRTFLFDLDGVLIDSTPVIRRGWETFAAARGVTVPEADFPLAMYGRRLAAEQGVFEDDACVAIATTLSREKLAIADLVINDFRGVAPLRLLEDLGV